MIIYEKEYLCETKKNSLGLYGLIKELIVIYFIRKTQIKMNTISCRGERARWWTNQERMGHSFLASACSRPSCRAMRGFWSVEGVWFTNQRVYADQRLCEGVLIEKEGFYLWKDVIVGERERERVKGLGWGWESKKWVSA